ncbi:glycoside hydrolase family 13 protein [Ceraceosorus bombacis]|uniref:Glycoside hydrolase family 13 protein n=1 Tax=Ceraceosorus bombacis TaxID=401625 RepID=A0A0P1BJ25_9BASI|nr:glycoside hydrolase family 13 protein [Ceraceosorus bombacis]
MALLPAQKPEWWKSAVVYQIYPSSFADSNGDGIGDLRGIIEKLPYIKSLGADVIWLCPHWASPGVDNGYDVSSYEAINPQFGTMQDNEDLLRAAHEQGLKVMFDLVVNHTSDQHEWFQASRSSRDDDRSDWFIWRDAIVDPKDGSRREPNNWASVWGGSAWTWDEKRGQYFFHIFSPQQPDLNWESGTLRNEVYEMAKRWKARGVDGWRLDAINFISKPQRLDASGRRLQGDFPDAPIVDSEAKYQDATKLYVHGPKVHQCLKELYKEALGPDTMTVGEAWGTTPEQSIAYTAWETREDRELQMVFSTEHVDLYGGLSPAPHTAPDHSKMRQTIATWQSSLISHGSWLSTFVSNHDLPRAIPNFLGPQAEGPEWRVKAAKLLALFQASQSGTLFVYQGEELGMTNVPHEWDIDQYRDLLSLDFYKNELAARRAKLGDPSAKVDMSDVMGGIRRKARDNSRTPFPWNGSLPTGGFSPANSQTRPWMPLNPDFAEGQGNINAASQSSDPNSVLNFWKRALALRKANPVLVYGTFKMHEVEQILPKDASEEDKSRAHKSVYAYERVLGDKKALYLGNWGFEEVRLDLTRVEVDESKEAALATQNASGHLLGPLEARLYLLEA